MRLALAGGEHASAPALAVAQPLNERRDRRARRDRQARQRLAGQHADVPATQALDGHAWFGTHAKNPYKHNTARRRLIDRPLVSIQLRDKIRRQSWALAVLRLVAHEAWHAGPAALAGSQMNVPRPVCVMFADPSHVVASGDMTSHEYEAFLGIFRVTTIPSGWTWRARWASNIAMANGGSRRWEVARLSGPPVARVRTTPWRSRDLKRPLPRATVRALEIAIQSLPKHAPWPEVDEEGWWREMLADRRLRRSASKSLSEKDEDAGQRLDHLSVKSLTFSCEWCGQRARLKVAELIALRARSNVRSIGRHILKCKDRRSRREGEECPNLSPTSRPQSSDRLAGGQGRSTGR